MPDPETLDDEGDDNVVCIPIYQMGNGMLTHKIAA